MEATPHMKRGFLRLFAAFCSSTVWLCTSYDALAQTRISAHAAWSPYLVGALIGVLVCVSLIVANKPIGASSAYSVIAGMIGKKLAPEHVNALPYYKEHSTKMNWSVVFLFGISLGSFIAAAVGGELTWRFLPPLWVSEFGEQSQNLRVAFSFIGGILLALGARLAGGCTSGHGISGALQLSVGSWVSLISFFVGGVIAANFMFG